MLPSDYYQRDLQQGLISRNEAQEEILTYLDQLYRQLKPPASRKTKGGWFGALKTAFQTDIKPIEAKPGKAGPKSELQGIYLSGNVGRGKTYLMDLLYQSLPVPKLRQHFYEFMTSIHVALKLNQGKVDPLREVVAKLARSVKVLCLDEFLVEDIADAMILSGFLHYLFEFKLILVTTSNVAPEHLYQDGLQRDRFLPAVHLITRHMQVLYLDTGKDYRLLKTLDAKRYYFPLVQAEQFLQAQFRLLNHGQELLLPIVTLNGR